MTLTLTPAQAAIIEDFVQQGTFDAPEKVLDAALALLSARKEEHDQELARLRAEIAIGDAAAERGELLEFDPEELLREVYAQLDAEQASGKAVAR